MRLHLDKKTKSAFAKIIAIRNSITIAMFFYIIYKALFISLLATSEIKKKLLELISNYFAIIETNKYRMLYLYCLI